MERPATRRQQSERWLRFVGLGLVVALPTLTLIPVGSLWLWQNGYLLHWAAAACLFVIAIHLVQRWLTPDAAAAPAAAPLRPAGEEGWTAVERQAWEDVRRLAAAARPDDLGSRDAVLGLGLDTIRAVARRLHPEVKDPLWRFTVPEALAITEQVAARLRRFVDETVPFSDRVTVAQALALYRWRGAVEVAEKAYDVWRVVRLANPTTAASHELRERLSRQMVDWGRQHVARVLVEAYVEEVGRAAIDLYGGRMRSGGGEAAASPILARAGDAAGAGGSEGATKEAQQDQAPSRLPRLFRQAGRAARLAARTLARRRR